MAKKKSAVNAVAFLDTLNGVPPTFGQALESIRETDGYTLAAFATKLGIARTNLHDIEKGRRGVSVERAAAWAKKLGYAREVFVALALQAEVDRARLKLRVSVEAA